jgi:hypothetical protein
MAGIAIGLDAVTPSRASPRVSGLGELLVPV